MIIADAHCDTLTKFPENPFDSNTAQWNANDFYNMNGRLQYFAIFTPPELSGDAAAKFAHRTIGNFYQKKNDKIQHLESASDYDSTKVNILLSLEGASPIINDIALLHAFYKSGIRAMGLTWNHRNFVADGVDNPYGLTEFGKEVVQEMEKIGMIIDVSHLNVAGFDDVVKHTSKAFIASHSNSRIIRDHKRNLYDEQIQEIIRRKGFIGINFYSPFLGDENQSENHQHNNQNLKLQFIKHVEHFLNLGCEDILGLGADFDGIDYTPFDGIKFYDEAFELLSKELQISESILNKFKGQNLLDYTLRMLN